MLLKYLRNVLSVLVAIAVTVGALVYAFWDVDFAVLWATLAGSALWPLWPMLLALFGFYWFTALRWVLILRPLGRFGVGQVSPSMMIGFGGNNILPAHLGELVRAALFARKVQLPVSGVFTTLLVERLFDVLSILFFYLLAVALIHPFPESIRLGSAIIAWFVGALLAGVFVFLRFPDPFVRLWDRLSRPLPEGLRQHGHRLLDQVRTGLHSLTSVRLLVPMVAYSLLKWLCGGVMVWLALHGYGTVIDPGVSMIVVAVMALAVTVPTTPGFFGAMQAAFVIALTPFGVSREVAIAASFYFQLSQWVPVTILGVVLFFLVAPSLRQVREDVEVMQQEV